MTVRPFSSTYNCYANRSWPMALTVELNSDRKWLTYGCRMLLMCFTTMCMNEYHAKLVNKIPVDDDRKVEVILDNIYDQVGVICFSNYRRVITLKGC